jgi:hypothetical protein
VEEWMYDWVDANPPAPERSFSARRTAKLFVAIMLGGILTGLPLAWLKLGLLLVAQHAPEEQQRQEQLHKDWIEMEKAAREGKAGEATRRLVGIKDPLPGPREPAAKGPE